MLASQRRGELEAAQQNAVHSAIAQQRQLGAQLDEATVAALTAQAIAETNRAFLQQNGGAAAADAATASLPVTAEALNAAQTLPSPVERDIHSAVSMACHSRAGLLTTSEGSVELSIMCFVQEQQ